MALDVTLDQLRTLETVARTGSFGAAAEVLHKVPSAVSYAIKGLEEALEITLFDRRRRTATLTLEGERILEAARDILGEVDTLDRLALQLRDGWEAQLRVVIDGALPVAPITRCLRQFSVPEIPTRLKLDVEYRHGVLDRFKKERADLMLILGFADTDDTSAYEMRALPDLELLLVGRGDHPNTELLVRDSSARVDSTSFTGSRHLVHLTDFHTKRIALLDGAGFGWVPHHLIRADLEEGTLSRVEIDGLSSWTYHPQIVWRANRPMGRAARLFIENLDV
jgi:DNA-binding transcriptional LysR family regulator